jgi:hypothetical protein
MSNKAIYTALDLAREAMDKEVRKALESIRTAKPDYFHGKAQGLMDAQLILADMLKAVNDCYMDEWVDTEAKLKAVVREWGNK